MKHKTNVKVNVYKTWCLCLPLILHFAFVSNVFGQETIKSEFGVDDKLMAWAFLAFDTEERTPLERAQMLKRAGFSKCGYEGHARYIGQLEEHIIAYEKCNIEMVGIYMEIRQENTLEQATIKETIDILKRQNYKTQFWLTVKDALLKGVPEENRVDKVCEYIAPIADVVLPMGCKIAMYNHGGWTGNPENQVKIVKKLKTVYDEEAIGIVLNFHHSHPYVDQFQNFFEKVKPHLFVLNTNGMRVIRNEKGELEPNPKILPLGEGDHEIEMLQVVKKSGYNGLIGVIDHTRNVNPELNLGNNLKTLHSIF